MKIRWTILSAMLMALTASHVPAAETPIKGLSQQAREAVYNLMYDLNDQRIAKFIDQLGANVAESNGGETARYSVIGSALYAGLIDWGPRVKLGPYEYLSFPEYSSIPGLVDTTTKEPVLEDAAWSFLKGHFTNSNNVRSLMNAYVPKICDRITRNGGMTESGSLRRWNLVTREANAFRQIAVRIGDGKIASYISEFEKRDRSFRQKDNRGMDIAKSEQRPDVIQLQRLIEDEGRDSNGTKRDLYQPRPIVLNGRPVLISGLNDLNMIASLALDKGGLEKLSVVGLTPIQSAYINIELGRLQSHKKALVELDPNLHLHKYFYKSEALPGLKDKDGYSKDNASFYLAGDSLGEEHSRVRGFLLRRCIDAESAGASCEAAVTAWAEGVMLLDGMIKAKECGPITEKKL